MCGHGSSDMCGQPDVYRASVGLRVHARPIVGAAVACQAASTGFELQRGWCGATGA